MDIADDDMLDKRIGELIERGLDRYGAGDMEGALSAWKHVVALDPDNERATHYISYVEDHHDLAEEDEASPSSSFSSESTVELDYPFGVEELGLSRLRDDELDDYESIEIVGEAEEDATKGARAESVDDGWNVDAEWVEELVNKGDESFAPASPEDDFGDVHLELGEEEQASGSEDDFGDLQLDLGDDHQASRPEDDFGKQPLELGDEAARPRTSKSDFGRIELELGDDDEEQTRARAHRGADDEEEPTRARTHRGADDEEEPTRARTNLGAMDANLVSDTIEMSLDDELPTMALRSPGEGLKDTGDLGAAGLTGNQPLIEEATLPGGRERDAPAVPGLGEQAFKAMTADPHGGFGQREESTAERSGARSSGFGELELEGLETPVPAIADALDEDRGQNVQISFRGPPAALDLDDDEDEQELTSQLPAANLLDEEETIARDRPPIRRTPRAPTQDHDITSTSVKVDEALLSLEDSTREISIGDLAGGTGLDPGDGARRNPPDESEIGALDLGDEQVAELEVGESPTRSTASGILAEIAADAPRGDAKERTIYIVSRLIEHAGDEFTDGNAESAAASAGHALDYASDNAVAQKLIFENERQLEQVLLAALGDLSLIPTLLVPLTELPLSEIDHRAAFLLTRIDGMLTLDEVLDVSGMSSLETLRHLSRLHASGYLKVG